MRTCIIRSFEKLKEGKQNTDNKNGAFIDYIHKYSKEQPVNAAPLGLLFEKIVKRLLSVIGLKLIFLTHSKASVVYK